MHQVTLIRQTLQPYLNWHGARIAFLALFLVALFRTRTINFGLKGYDYASSGAYFITLCTHQRQCLFGDIIAGEMQLNLLGEIVAEEWQRTPEIRPNFAIDCWIVMPNHFHGIVIIDHPDRSPSCQKTYDGVPHGINCIVNHDR